MLQLLCRKARRKLQLEISYNLSRKPCDQAIGAGALCRGKKTYKARVANSAWKFEAMPCNMQHSFFLSSLWAQHEEEEERRKVIIIECMFKLKVMFNCKPNLFYILSVLYINFMLNNNEWGMICDSVWLSHVKKMLFVSSSCSGCIVRSPLPPSPTLENLRGGRPRPPFVGCQSSGDQNFFPARIAK